MEPFCDTVDLKVVLSGKKGREDECSSAVG